MMRFAAGMWLITGCSGGTSDSPEVSPGEGSLLPAALIAGSWQVRLVDPAARARFESTPGWVSLFTKELPQALEQLGDDPVGLARLHTEYSALCRQGLLMYAHATQNVYGERLQETDPLAVPYLRGVSEWLLGDTESARASLASVPEGAGPEVVARAAAWLAVVDVGWPPVLDEGLFFGGLPEVAPGVRPEILGLPHYRLPEQSAEALVIETSDPAVLLSLALWHEAAARAAAGDDNDAAVSALLAPWRLPAEPVPEIEWSGTVDDGWLFGGFYPSAADAAFVAAGSVEGIVAVEAWSDRSLLAAAILPAVVDGHLDPERMLDQAAELESALMAAMSSSAGMIEGYHQPFAALGELSALRAAMVVADANDQYRDAGVLRLNALDLASGPGWDPIFVLSVAAWSAGNENTVRAEELVHKLSTRYPAVDAARYPLDALHIRRSRGSMQLAPAH
jgi:hypothetical protein